MSRTPGRRIGWRSLSARSSGSRSGSPLRWFPVSPHPRLLLCAGGQTLDEVPADKGEDYDDRHGFGHGRCGENAPIDVVLLDEGPQTHGQGLLPLVHYESRGEHVFRPGPHKREDGRRRDARRGERKDDEEEDAHPPGTVDGRRLLDP